MEQDLTPARGRGAGRAGARAAGAGPGPARAPDAPAPLPGRGALTILHLLAPAPAGGLERVVQLLATGQAALGHRVHVGAILGPGDDAGAFAAPLRAAGVTVHELVLPARAYLRERRAVGALCRALRPDVVHTHGARPDVLDAGVARRLGVPTTTTVHGFTGGDRRNRAYEWLQRRAFGRMDAVVAVSAPLAEQLGARGVERARIHEIRNAWAPGPARPAVPRAQLGIAPDAFHIGWVGRLSPEKAADVLLAALPRLADLPVVVSYVGEGGERPRLEALAASLGVSGRVHWHGLVPDAQPLFPTFDVLVLSSHTEGTPMVLFEAMHARTPIVATRVGGVPDVVGATALLVPPRDPAALAGAIRAVHDEPHAAAERAALAAARLRRRFGYDAWLRRYDLLYRSISGR